MFELNGKDIIMYYVIEIFKNYVGLKILKEVFKAKALLLKEFQKFDRIYCCLPGLIS